MWCGKISHLTHSCQLWRNIESPKWHYFSQNVWCNLEITMNMSIKVWHLKKRPYLTQLFHYSQLTILVFSSLMNNIWCHIELIMHIDCLLHAVGLLKIWCGRLTADTLLSLYVRTSDLQEYFLKDCYLSSLPLASSHNFSAPERLIKSHLIEVSNPFKPWSWLILWLV